MTKSEVENALSELIEDARKQAKYWANQENRYMGMLYGISHPGSWEASEFKGDIQRFVEAQECAEGGE